MTFIPSKSQNVIFNEVQNTKNNILINAVAGSGKSTTIIKALDLIPTNEATIFLAFNRDIVRELKTKVPAHVNVKTLHSFGLNELKFRFARNISLDNLIDDSKISNIAISHVSRMNDENLTDNGARISYAAKMERLVDIFRMCLPQSRKEVYELCEKFDIIAEDLDIERAKDILRESNADTKKFDYTDMIYRPAIGDWRLKQHKYVFLDEAQDLNRAQQEMVKKIVDPNGGRLIVVGDPKQAIYGFGGADSDSFDKFKTMFPNTVELPLSVCYRCPVEVIEHAKEKVDYIECRENAPSGEVRQGSITEINSGDFVLCRNTRPLVSLCLKFIGEGKKATIKGSDIGRGLINMVKQTGVSGIDAVFNKLAKELNKLIDKANKQYPLKPSDEVSYVANMNDRISALRSISKECKDAAGMISLIAEIFTDNVTGIVFSTIHKAKGLEANNIFIIDRFRMPAPFARQKWERTQEDNLDYVARTRAKDKLIYVNDWISDVTKTNNLHSSLMNIKESPIESVLMSGDTNTGMKENGTKKVRKSKSKIKS